ncbi:MAG: LysM peptidoglycan-binding domain-containing protein [Chitinophagaceae bacterium]
MKNLLVLSFLFHGIVCAVKAQPVELIIKSGNKSLYLDHIVAPSQGLFAIGRLYSVHPKFIADYNKLNLNAGLAIGQLIHIPLTDTNFSQQSKKGTPVYYIVGESEGLLKVSNANNKVTMQKLRDWNRLTNDNVAAGKKMIVGFLLSKEMEAFAAKNSVKVEQDKALVKPVQEKDKLKEQPIQQQDKAVVKAEPKKVKIQEQPVKQQEKPVVKTEPEKDKPISKAAEEEKTVKKIAVEDKAVVKIDPAKETVQIKEDPKKTEPVFAKDDIVDPNASEHGYFKTSFDQQVRDSPASKNATVTSGIFKTTSGWQDAKYYLLIDDVATGTIVKISNPENNKTVYAKVLGEMNGIRQNQGLNIRISNAASTALGVSDTEKFIVKVIY